MLPYFSPFSKLSIKDLELFYDCSHGTAIARKKELRAASGRSSVRIYDLAAYECISCLEVFKTIRVVQKSTI